MGCAGKRLLLSAFWTTGKVAGNSGFPRETNPPFTSNPLPEKLVEVRRALHGAALGVCLPLVGSHTSFTAIVLACRQPRCLAICATRGHGVGCARGSPRDALPVRASRRPGGSDLDVVTENHAALVFHGLRLVTELDGLSNPDIAYEDGHWV